MSVDYNALITIGFKVTSEEVFEAYKAKKAAGKDADAWFDSLIDNDRLIQFDCYRAAEFYIYAVPEKTNTIGEGRVTSVSDVWSNLNYCQYEDFINQFKEDFPMIDITTHQLDVFMGLRVS